MVVKENQKKMPKDKSQLPKWWKPVATLNRAVYEVSGVTLNGIQKTLHIVALNEIYAAQTAKDQFYIYKVESITLKLDGVWVPRSL